MAGEPGEVGDSGVRDDQLRLRVRVDEPLEVVGDRRQPATAVDEDGHPPLRRQLEHGREAGVVQQELLRARVELDPMRAAVEAPLRLGNRLLAQVEPDVWDHPPLRPFRERERAVVPRTEAGVAIGLVQAEDVAAGHPIPVEHRLELLVPADHAVDVVAEVRVGVEDVRTGRHLGPQLGLEFGEELARAFQRLHEPTLPRWLTRTSRTGSGSGTRARARSRPIAARR